MISRFVLAALLGLSFTSIVAAQGKPTNTLRIEPVGEGEGKSLQLDGFFYVGSPCYSKDGEWIAFDGYKGDNAANITSECWVVRSDGTDARRLAKGATPRWSPDGKQLLFMREERADIGRPGGDNVGVFVINADGTDEKYLVDGRWPEWSPDGKQIAFSVGGKPRGGARPGSRICIANVDGSEQREIAIGDCPSWSPDGKQIACCYYDPAQSAPMIRLVDVANTDEQKLLGYGWFRANWSTDGEHLYANGVAGQDGFGRARTGMIRLSLGEKIAAEALLSDFTGQSPCPSPDGKSVVFCTSAEETGQVQ